MDKQMEEMQHFIPIQVYLTHPRQSSWPLDGAATMTHVLHAKGGVGNLKLVQLSDFE